METSDGRSQPRLESVLILRLASTELKIQKYIYIYIFEYIGNILFIDDYLRNSKLLCDAPLSESSSSTHGSPPQHTINSSSTSLVVGKPPRRAQGPPRWHSSSSGGLLVVDWVSSSSVGSPRRSLLRRATPRGATHPSHVGMSHLSSSHTHHLRITNSTTRSAPATQTAELDYRAD